jgi:hypothetical protein
MVRSLSSFLVGNAALLLAPGAGAVPTTYVFTGEVTLINNECVEFLCLTFVDDMAANNIFVGTQVSGSFAYDPDWATSDSWSDGFIYAADPLPITEFSIGDLQITLSEAGSLGVHSRISGTELWYDYEDDATFDALFPPGCLACDWRLLIADLPSPPNLPPIPGPSRGCLDAAAGMGVNCEPLEFSITSIHPVPEPSTALVLTFGLVGIAAGRRRTAARFR